MYWTTHKDLFSANFSLIYKC